MNQKSKFGRLSVKGFRRLYDTQIDFTNRPLCAIIGANGVGKSSLLHVFRLLASSATGTLQKYLSLQGNPSNIVTRGRSEAIRIGLATAEDNNVPLNYVLDVAQRGTSYEIVHESLTEQISTNAPKPFKYIDSNGLNIRYSDPKTNKLEKPTWRHNDFEASLSQVPKMYERPERFREILASFAFFGNLDVSERSPIRLPQPFAPVAIPQTNGEETVTALYNLQQSAPDRYDLLIDSLRTVYPDLKSLGFLPVASGQMSMLWNEERYSKPFYANELSEGTLRFLWLATILLSESLPQLITIDEPEVSMHPLMIENLVTLLREAAKRTQIVIATHSERLVSNLAPDEVLVADMEEGETTFAWADQKENLEPWLEDYSLGQIWAMNLIGGRP